MKNSLIILTMLIALTTCQQVTISTTCSCAQMLTSADCGRKTGCSWDDTKKVCAIPQTPTTPTTDTYAAYCDQYTVGIDCAKDKPCAWNGTACTHFTGCTAFTYTETPKCQEVSTRCITDGVHCVEKAACSTYKTKTSCIVNSSGRYCYWNTSDAANLKCEDADDCFKLPPALNTDALCRAELTKCTTTAAGGCVESAAKCENQIDEQGCVNNKDLSQACFWASGKCLDKTCDNALTSLTTDDQCKKHLATCTTKQGGGCVTRSGCSGVILNACVKDNLGNDCFWNGTACVNKTCANALATNKSNSSCQSYLGTCITTGAGCVDNTGCDAAKLKDACDKTLANVKCSWDSAANACKVKKCINAGTSYAGHDQCTLYDSSCTANGATGCTDRTCDNAPISNNTNDSCKLYFPTGNCVAKNGGGCRTNTTCDKIDLQSACVADINGKTCFWDSGSCKSNICTNSPAANNSHSSCQIFSTSCTVGSGNTCVDMTCENIQSDVNCSTDLKNNPCIYKGKCYKKQCSLASKGITLHDDCQNYLPTCTLDNSGQGCMDLPLKCEAITNVGACKIKSGGGKCGLSGTNCVDQSCATAPADGTLTTNILCNGYKTGCVVNNDADGCMDLPATCGARKLETVCEYEQGSVSLADKCEWDDQTAPASPVCIDIKCENAHLVSLKVAGVTQSGCWGYNSLKCVITTTGSVSTCIPRPKSCSSLVQSACNQTGVIYVDKDTNKNCFWDEGSSSCKDVACASITTSSSYTHDYCYGKINTCTVNAAVGTACIALKSCDKYIVEQCKINADGNQCKWNGTSCVDLPCGDAEDSTSYDTDTKCQTFSKLCTLTQKKCTVKKAACTDYKNQVACQMNTIGGTQCTWSGACANSSAAFDCTKVIGVGLTVGYCSKLDSTCSVNAAGTACLVAKTNCSGYGDSATCKWASTDKYCAYIGSSCVKDCTAATGPFDLATCQAFSSICTVKLDGTGCVNMVDTCANTSAANCTKSTATLCYMVSSTCTAATTALTTCSNVTGTRLTAAYCMGISANACSANAAQTACVAKSDTCGSYTSTSCFYAINDKDCFWTAAGTCIKKSLVKCTDYSGNSILACQAKKSSCTWTTPATTCSVDCTAASGPFDLTSCQSYDLSCTVKLDGTGCVAMATDCATTVAANCTKSNEGLCYPTATPSCQVATTPLGTCANVSGKTRLTAAYCKGISANACSVLADQTACVAIADTCAEYLTPFAGCFSALNEPKCVMNAGGAACAAFDDATDACSTIKINSFTSNYTDYHCKLYKTSCKAKTDGSGCEDEVSTPAATPSCSSFTGVNLTYYQCIDKKSTCSVNAAKTACIDAQNTCSSYAQGDCGFSTNEGECYWTGTACAQKTCDGAATTITDMTGCLTYSPNCVQRAGGCQLRATCASYLVPGACKKNSSGGDCLWNPTAGKCVDFSCTAAEATTNFDTNDDCKAIGKCTVKANADKTVGQGCIARTACSNYVNQEQCYKNDKDVDCIWNENDEANKVCADKSCATAPLTTITHETCKGYLAGCTVNIVDVGGTATPKGCTPFKACKDYSAEIQCVTSSEKDSDDVAIVCGWNGTACANKSCETAQSTVNTATACAGYFTGCTVNAADNGCIAIPDKCEGMTKNQCFTDSLDSKGRECYWLDDTTGCVTKTCENSPLYDNQTQCDDYLAGCTTDTVKCKTKICEDFPLTTDTLCKTALANGSCTSNGVNCVLRGTCGQAQAEAGCITDSTGKLCQWMTPANQTAYCTIRTCSTAPSTLTTEEQCKQYYTPGTGTCTTKKDGGCTLKGACTAATVEAACKTDNNGADCWWDTDRCRLKECKDFLGSTHAACYKQRTNCTAGLSGKCALMANCEATTLRAACIVGSNGACLWVAGYVNADSSKGACFRYDSCKSLAWLKDDKCKLISPNCTTDGTQCVGITSCAETNINGGCESGTDGQCIQTASAKGVNDTICKKYTSCDAAYYLTHELCNDANPNCTSDYVNGCIPLAACSTYSKQEQCHYNKDGAIKDTNGYITSTGNCAWDATANSCKDEQCKDITLTTEWECSAKLKTCSTDGTTCIVKGACNTYTSDNACNKAGGTEGACFWVVAVDTTPATCRTKTCADIPNGTSTTACLGVSNCVSNGTNCIAKAACTTYATKTSCMSSGTDGLCVWTDAVAPATQGKCALMTECASAKDETTCNQASNRCSWNTTTKACAVHTCDTYKAQVGSCKFFYSWDLKKYNTCYTKDGKCQATDAGSIPEADCYQLTAYQYSWNPTSSKCTQCGTVVPDNNNSNNNSNNTNGTTTDSGYILAWTSAVLAYLVF